MKTHISDDDLERYYLGMITQETELAPLEEHIIGCPLCAERAEETQDCVDAIRAALIQDNYDTVLPATKRRSWRVARCDGSKRNEP